MRASRANSLLFFLTALGACVLVLLPWAARAGGPWLVAGPDGLEGTPFTWDPALPVPYRIDGGPMARKPNGTIAVTNATGVLRVQAGFKVWEDVPTASIRFTHAGSIQSSGVFTDGDVDTIEEFDAVFAACNAGTQNPSCSTPTAASSGI